MSPGKKAFIENLRDYQPGLPRGKRMPTSQLVFIVVLAVLMIVAVNR